MDETHTYRHPFHKESSSPWFGASRPVSRVERLKLTKNITNTHTRTPPRTHTRFDVLLSSSQASTRCSALRIGTSVRLRSRRLSAELASTKVSKWNQVDLGGTPTKVSASTTGTARHHALQLTNATPDHTAPHRTASTGHDGNACLERPPRNRNKQPAFSTPTHPIGRTPKRQGRTPKRRGKNTQKKGQEHPREGARAPKRKGQEHPKEGARLFARLLTFRAE